jgi:hypothetical protein
LFNYWKDKVRFQIREPKAYGIWETLVKSPVSIGACVGLDTVLPWTRDFSGAEHLYRQALAIIENEDPGSADRGTTLGDLAGSIYSQNRLDDAAQPYHQALNTLDSRAFHLGGVQELHRLFDELELRERAMIVCDALPGMRRRELMGPQWCDLNFLEMFINIVRAVVD